ncbi:MAG: 60 kDa inner membrane insertion protein [Parcubacteria group bacterium GW2011_GWA1_47_11]|uniref:Membrane insertase YidC/Oxa/ALB C-terminal domain-containing protein n=1 Tax=Candidatus Yanofskybacteria bacterium RIFCSPHIGHO2_01_FULL_48_25b TaxID=1802672 RepID=A0A1F8EZX9_9BACT|nr:MAG: 60 kDa inner membrane insertion protein [Parcubacteria group bacterium GW2011_GWA1_47_11]OGN06437.1 MAG: hypothetical protein A2669_01580 [Candidatus Yanofskybacteria bacterium RIFCSPHIGHO2_01_FULL_48_25b]
MSNIFKIILYAPLFNALIFLSSFMPNRDLGLAIIALTVVIRLIFLPLSMKAQRSQKALNAIGPKIQAIKDKYKNDRTAQGAAMMQLYKDNNINPVAGCVPILIQLPILIALYQAFIAGLKPESLSMLYSFVPSPESLNTLFLGFLNIAGKNPLLAVLAGVLQYFQAKQSMSYMKASGAGASPQVAAINAQMLYFLPIMIIVLGWSLPAGLVLYWITTTVFSVGEQMYLKRNQ